jgi:hypothetical protein
MLPDIWLKALGDLSVAAFESACEEYLQRGKFFPTVADIRQTVEDESRITSLPLMMSRTPTAKKIFAQYERENAAAEARRAGMDGPASDGKPKTP